MKFSRSFIFLTCEITAPGNSGKIFVLFYIRKWAPLLLLQSYVFFSYVGTSEICLRGILSQYFHQRMKRWSIPILSAPATCSKWRRGIFSVCVLFEELPRSAAAGDSFLSFLVIYVPTTCFIIPLFFVIWNKDAQRRRSGEGSNISFLVGG